MTNKVEMACKDCSRCTGSAVENAGKAAGRATLAMVTMGGSLAVRAFRGKCRQCGHPMAAHDGPPQQSAGATVNVTVQAAPPPPPPVTQVPPAGWYPDTEQPGRQRYWDGQSWTEHRA